MNSSIIQPIAGKDKEVHGFAKGISTKVNVTVQLEFEIAYYDVAFQEVNHYAT